MCLNRTASPGERLRSALQNASEQERVIPFVGIDDLFSASLAAERFGALFLSSKWLLSLPDYLAKLEAVLRDRSSLVEGSRTDASDPEEIQRRVQAYEQAGCDAVLADGIKHMDLIRQLRRTVYGPLFCNVIGGGKVPAGSGTDLEAVGEQGLTYSTPCLFAAHGAIEQDLHLLTHDDAPLGDTLAGARDLLTHCHALLEANLGKAAWA